MKSDVPWQIEGVRRQARETARDAARRSGLSVGEWLDNVILDSALHDGVEPGQPTQPQYDPHDNAERGYRDEGLQRLEALYREQSLRPWRGGYADDNRRRGRTPDDDRAPPFEYLEHPYATDPEPRQPPEPYLRPDYQTRPDYEARPEHRDLPSGYGERQRPDPFARPDPLARAEERYPLAGYARRRPDPFARPEHLARPEEHRQSSDDDTRQRTAELAERLSLAPVEDYRPAVDQGFADLNNRLDSLTKQLGQLAEMNAASAQQARPEPPVEEAPHQLVEVISRLDHRLDELIAEARSAKTEMEQRVSAVDRAVADLGRERPPAAPAAEPPTPLDQAMIEIADRQRALDGYASPAAGGAVQAVMHSEALPRPRTQELAGLEQQLRQINTQIETLRQPCTLDKAVDTLRDDLAEIGVMLQDAMPRKAVEALEGEVRKLADRVDLIGGNTQDPAAFKQLEGAIVALRGIVSQAASNDALAKLSEQVRAIGDKVEQAANPAAGGVLSALEGRIAMLADALEARNRNGQNVPHQVEAVVAGLVDKIERLQLTRGDQAAVGHLEDRIARLVEKLDASDARLNHLEAIERGLADLLVHLEHQRASSVVPAAAASPEMDALSREVADLKQTEKTTQDSLEVVHGTLGHVVERLASIETDMRARPVAPPKEAAAQAFEPAAAEVPAQAAAPIEAILREPAAQPPKSVAPAAPERRPIDPSLPPDHPLEPGSSVARGRGPGSPADRIAASEAALGGARPPVVPDPAGGKANFIAAARRAAQAAGREAPAKTDTVAPIDAKATGGKLTSRAGMLRGLLGGVAAVLIILASLHIARTYLGSSNVTEANAPAVPSEPTATPAAETPPPASNAGEPETPAAPAAPPPAGRQSTLFPAIDGTTITVPSSGNIVPSDRDPTGTVAPAAKAVAAPVPPHAPAPAVAATQTPAAPVAPPTAMDRLPTTFSSALRAAAAKGDPAAQYEVALRYAEGRGVTQNLSDAAEWFERAAKQGLVPAQFRLGGFYEKGLGVTKNLDAARRFYLAAGEAGNAKALHNLAVLYAEGIDGKPDYQTAARWFRKAADYGVLDSQYNLAILYARGIGVEQNLTEAYRWFGLAARNGDADAAKKRDEIGSRLDQRSLKAATQAVQTWTAEPQPDAAVQVKTPAGGWDSAGAAAATTGASTPSKRKPPAPGPKLDLSTPRSAQ